MTIHKDETLWIECDICHEEITREYSEAHYGFIQKGDEHYHWECKPNQRLKDLALIEHIMDDALERAQSHGR